MKNNFKIVCSALAGFLLGGLTIVGANQAIQALQNTEIKVKLNGHIQEFKDETTGEIQYPITYHDRTYLPLRNIANLAGLSVAYDQNTNTAILNTAKNHSFYDEQTGLTFSQDFFTDEWDQVSGMTIYYIAKYSDGDSIGALSIDISERTADDVELSSKLKNILGIQAIYVTDDEDFSTYINSIAIKYEDNTYGLLNLVGDPQVKTVTSAEIRQRVEG